MDEKTIEIFENEFYGFVQLVSKNPALLKQNSAELKRILNRLLVIKDSAALETIVQGLRAAGLLNSPFYHHASAVIQEVEENLKTAVSNRNLQNITFSNSNVVNKPRSSDKKFAAAMNFVRG